MSALACSIEDETIRMRHEVLEVARSISEGVPLGEAIAVISVGCVDRDGVVDDD